METVALTPAVAAMFLDKGTTTLSDTDVKTAFDSLMDQSRGTDAAAQGAPTASLADSTLAALWSAAGLSPTFDATGTIAWQDDGQGLVASKPNKLEQYARLSQMIEEDLKKCAPKKKHAKRLYWLLRHSRKPYDLEAARRLLEFILGDLTAAKD